MATFLRGGDALCLGMEETLSDVIRDGRGELGTKWDKGRTHHLLLVGECLSCLGKVGTAAGREGLQQVHKWWSWTVSQVRGEQVIAGLPKVHLEIVPRF